MSIRLGIVMDPIASIAFKKDSSLAMLLAAQARGWSLFYMEQADLYQAQSVARARTRALRVFDNPAHWFELDDEQDIALGDLDVLLMRKDPPFDNEFVYSTYLLEQAEQAGVLVVNRPQSLRDCNEKLFATQFPQCTPKTLVSRRADILREFAREHRDIILKPLDGMGGSSIFRHREGDPNLSVILETLTAHGQQQIMAQVGPTLREKGLLFVGLDVIGEHLTEINVTSPTCIREIDNAFGTRIAEQLMAVIAAKLEARATPKA